MYILFIFVFIIIIYILVYVTEGYKYPDGRPAEKRLTQKEAEQKKAQEESMQNVLIRNSEEIMRPFRLENEQLRKEVIPLSEKAHQLIQERETAEAEVIESQINHIL